MAITLLNEKYYVDDLLLIKRNKYSHVMNEPFHTHDFLELIYVYKGECEHYIDNQKYNMGPGDLLFVNYGSNHGFNSQRALEYVNIIIKPDFINKNLFGVENAFALLTLADFSEFSKTVNQSKRHIHFSDQERTLAESLIESMEKEKAFPESGSEIILKSSLDIFLTMVFRKMSLPLNSRMYLDSELLQYIEKNCSQNLTLKKISAMCFYNPSYFSRAFKKYTGKSFVVFLSQCRIRRALSLLENTDDKVDVIIEKCGFTNRTEFFKKFYDVIGMTPFQYRKSKK